MFRHAALIGAVAAPALLTATTHAAILDVSGGATIDTVTNPDGFPGDLVGLMAGDRFEFAMTWDTATDEAFVLDPTSTNYVNEVMGTGEFTSPMNEPIAMFGFVDAAMTVTDGFPVIPSGDPIEERDELTVFFSTLVDGQDVDLSLTFSGDAMLYNDQDIPVGITLEDYDSATFTVSTVGASATGTVTGFAIVPAPGAAIIASIGLLGLARRDR